MFRISKIIGTAALIGGIAALISYLEKEAKKEGKDIDDVAKEKVNELVEEAKSGELVDKAKKTANDFYEDVKSGEFTNKAKKTANDLYEDAKSGELTKNIKETANDIAENAIDGLKDMIDGKGTNDK